VDSGTTTIFSSILKSRVGNILPESPGLRINLNLDGTSIASKSHTHPSQSQTSRLLTSFLSLDVPGFQEKDHGLARRPCRESTLKTSINTTLPTCDEKGVFTGKM
jgi:hypothetical protein